jgi:hypothetical protein
LRGHCKRREKGANTRRQSTVAVAERTSMGTSRGAGVLVGATIFCAPWSLPNGRRFAEGGFVRSFIDTSKSPRKKRRAESHLAYRRGDRLTRHIYFCHTLVTIRHISGGVWIVPCASVGGLCLFDADVRLLSTVSDTDVGWWVNRTGWL